VLAGGLCLVPDLLSRSQCPPSRCYRDSDHERQDAGQGKEQAEDAVILVHSSTFTVSPHALQVVYQTVTQRLRDSWTSS
jgi:hypothetical protein